MDLMSQRRYGCLCHRDVNSADISFPSIDRTIPGLDFLDFLDQEELQSQLVIGHPVAEKSLSNCIKVASTLTKRQETAAIARYTYSMLRRQFTMLTVSRYNSAPEKSPLADLY